MLAQHFGFDAVESEGRIRFTMRGQGALMLDAIPDAGTMLADKGYDADWFRSALKHSGIVPCIPSRSNCKIPIE